MKRKTGHTAMVTLNRPERLDALNPTLKGEVTAALQDAVADETVRVVVITGGEKAFCAGADIKERTGLQLTQTRFYFAQRKNHDFYNQIEDLEKPVIAAVSGVAVGGGFELALACNLRVASETARFGLPEARIGVMPAAGGTQRLPRLIGPAPAKELLFTGRFMDAREALRLGVVNRVVPVEDFMGETLSLAEQIAANPPLSVAFCKQAVNVWGSGWT